MKWQSLLSYPFRRNRLSAKRLSPAKRSPDRRSIRRRAFFEPLEDRRVLASISLGSGGEGSWGLDPAFSGDGRAIADVSLTTDFAWDVALQGDGKIVAVGTAFQSSDDFAVVRFNADGTLDSTFDGDGVATIDFGGGNDVAKGVAIQADGKIVVVGSAIVGTNQFALARLNANGSLDAAFGAGGKVTSDLTGGDDLAEAVVLQPDGKILVVGTVNGSTDVGVARYNSTGSLDTGFGTGGLQVIDFDEFSSENGADIALAPDGQIVVAGRVANSTNQVGIARLNAVTGTLDPTFNGDGRALTSLPSMDGGVVEALAVQGDGSIIAVGHMTTDAFDEEVFLQRYTPSGALENGFGSGGLQTFGSGAANEQGFDVALQADGKIVVVGASDSTGNNNFLALRFDGPSGALDTTFATGGVQVDFAGNSDMAHAAAIQSDGKIVLAGRRQTNSAPDAFAVARLAITGGTPTFSINENGSVSLSGTYTTDFPASATITIAWGDGNTTPVAVTGASGSFTVSHTYLDDGPTSAPSDVNTITATIQDSGGNASATAQATIANVNPQFGSIGSTSVNENGTATISGSFTDVGTLDTHSILVTWGDGNTSPAVVDPQARTFSASHQYLDDNPTGTSSDVFAVGLSLADDDGGSAVGSTSVAVNNVAPVAGNISAPPVASRGSSVSFAGSFTDVGTQDTHEVAWDFGDGTQIPFQSSTAPGALTPSHAYSQRGVYTVKFTVRDDDLGQDVETRKIVIVVAQIGPDHSGLGTALTVGGTEEAETIALSAVASGVTLVVNSVNLGTFAPTTRLIVEAGGGDDQVVVNGSLPAWIYGGQGSDILCGGGGPDMIQGQEGSDQIAGGGGRDLLIGGLGADRIVGSSEDDILIAGTTDHDADSTALLAIVAEWTSSRSYLIRVANLTGGVPLVPRENGSYFLSMNTVHDDGQCDKLSGTSGFDWFFANLTIDGTDLTKDKITDEGLLEFAFDID